MEVVETPTHVQATSLLAVCMFLLKVDPFFNHVFYI